MQAIEKMHIGWNALFLWIQNVVSFSKIDLNTKQIALILFGLSED
jgi:hypothetical protein